MIDKKDIVEAIDRIARTSDGWLLYCHLHDIAMSPPPDAEPSDSALRAEFGRRKLARELMNVMAKGIDDSGGRTSSTGPGGSPRSERPVIVGASPVAVSKRESPREWLARTDPELKPASSGDK